MDDAAETIEQIKRLPKDVKAHLSHAGRNGILKVFSAYRLGHDVPKAIREFEKTWTDMGL